MGEGLGGARNVTCDDGRGLCKKGVMAREGDRQKRITDFRIYESVTRFYRGLGLQGNWLG